MTENNDIDEDFEDDGSPILDEVFPLALLFSSVMDYADRLEAGDPTGHGANHAAFRLRGMADACNASFHLIVNELRYAVGSAIQEDEDALIPGYIWGIMDAADMVDRIAAEENASVRRAAKRAERSRHRHKGQS